MAMRVLSLSDVKEAVLERLPAGRDASQAAAESSAQPRTPCAKIVVVDQDAEVCEQFDEIFKEGYSIHALSRFEDREILLDTLYAEAVFLDAHTPEQGIGEAIKFIRTYHVHVPIAVMIGLDDGCRIADLFALGADAFILKPFTGQEARDFLGALTSSVKMLPRPFSQLAAAPRAPAR